MAGVIVIGGGVVGQSAAYQLARDGVAVTLIDRADAGQATAAGAGIISPGTGALGAGPLLPLASAAVAFYPELLAHLTEDGETDTGFAICGGLFVATNEDEAAQLPGRFRAIEERRAAGLRNIGEIAMLDGREARRLFPPLAAIPSAIHLSEVGRVNGRLLRDALRRAAVRRGATLIEGSAEIIHSGGRATGVRVAEREIAADGVIVAGGAWTNLLGEALGVTLPIYPQRGQIMHLDLPGVVTTKWPVILGFHSHYILAFPESRVVAGATREHDSGYDPRMTAGGVHEALGEALRVAPGLAGATLHEVRIGLRPASPDGLPVLGAVPGLDNVYVATGHGASGLQLGPQSGAMVAGLAQRQAAPIDLAPFAATRFAG
ncbi:MAG TPA: FAD-dependent oxidoreductase [Thermomicrobiales bacterium]|jgi:D-amino-acid dehydrogenase